MKMAMTSIRSVSVAAVVIFVVSCSSAQNVIRSTEFRVGGDKDWTIPNSEDRDMYNEWASKHRFKINDTLRFKYEKDSVLVVTEADYHKCKASSHPIFFSNNEDTLFRLDRSGLFYFISGVSGHCQRGQKMIIKVLEEEEQHYSQPPSSSSSATTTTDAHHNSGVTSTTASCILLPIMALGGVFLIAPACLG